MGHFIKTLIAHMPDRVAALSALRKCHEIQQSSSAYGGKVSAFLSKRRTNRLKKVRTIGNWEEHFTRGDEAHPMRRYFYNNATQMTQWHTPPEFEDLGASICEDECADESYN